VDWQFGTIQPVSWYPSVVFPYLDVEKLFQLPFFTLQVMNRKLAATNIAENQATDGKQSV
jgi:hypothetical protein